MPRTPETVNIVEEFSSEALFNRAQDLIAQVGTTQYEPSYRAVPRPLNPGRIAIRPGNPIEIVQTSPVSFFIPNQEPLNLILTRRSEDEITLRVGQFDDRFNVIKMMCKLEKSRITLTNGSIGRNLTKFKADANARGIVGSLIEYMSSELLWEES